MLGSSGRPDHFYIKRAFIMNILSNESSCFINRKKKVVRAHPIIFTLKELL